MSKTTQLDPLATVSPTEGWPALRQALMAGDMPTARTIAEDLGVDAALLPLFGAAVLEHAEATALVEAGRGQRDEAGRLDTQRGLLQAMRPATPDDAKTLVEKIDETTRAWATATNLAGAGDNAAYLAGRLEAAFPELFGLSGAPRKARLEGRTATECAKLGFDPRTNVWLELVRPQISTNTRRRVARAI